jgi:hypothetical protein
MPHWLWAIKSVPRKINIRILEIILFECIIVAEVLLHGQLNSKLFPQTIISYR